MEELEESYQVKLDSFTGPLDLLLHLIRKNEINIYDIPIALITQQYLEYIYIMKDLNLSLAGEFLVMAATLVQIKSRMLLPKEEVEAQEEEEGEDPRSELVRRLVEYQQYKEAAGQLSEQERLWRDMFRREPMVQEKSPPREILLEDVGLFDLLEALQDVLTRTESRELIEITPEALTVQDRINSILERLETESSLTFSALFDDVLTRSMVIVTFLAILELVRIRLVRVYQGDYFGPIHITRAFLSEGVTELSSNDTGTGNDEASSHGGVDA
jgi:segregation and condensation protein A